MPPRFSFLLLFHCFLSGAICAQSDGFVNYTVADGLLHSTVYYTMQDSRGFTWFCTQTGVNRFDGRNWLRYTIEDGLTDNEVFKCFEDSKHRIWFLTFNEKLCYLKEGVFTYVPLQGSSTKRYGTLTDYLFACGEDLHSGDLYFSLRGGTLLRYSDKQGLRIDSRWNNRLELFYQKNGDLCAIESPCPSISIAECNLSKGRVTETFESELGAEPCSFPLQNAFAYSDKVGFVFGTPKGIYHIYKGRCKSLFPLSSFPGTLGITALFGAGPDLWVGCDNSIYLIRNFEDPLRAVIERKYYKKGVTSLLFDQEENLWATTHLNGVYFKPGSEKNIRNIQTAFKDGNENVFSVYTPDLGKTIIAGLPYGECAWFGRDSSGDERVNIQVIDTRVMNRLKFIFQRNDKIYLGGDFGLYSVDLKSRRTGIQKGVNGNLKNYAIDTSGNIWLITPYLLTKLDRFLKPRELKLTKRAYAVAPVDSDQFYIGDPLGLYRFSGSTQVKNLSTLSRFLRNGVSDLLYTDGILWVASPGGGLVILRDEKLFKEINPSNGLVGKICQNLYDDGRGHVWVCTNTGISVVDKRDFSVFNITSADGLPSDDVKDIFVDASGQAYAATAKGLSIFRLENLPKVKKPPGLYLRHFQVNDKKLPIAAAIRFNHTYGQVSAHLAAISYQTPDKIVYRYRFLGEEDWQTDNTGTINFYNLAPGNYTLEAQAKQYKSGWSPALLLQIEVVPLWYESLIFRIAIALSLTAAIALILVLRIRSLQRRAAEQNRVRMQISELEGKALSAQMNPHFIFNSLNAVQQLILDEELNPALKYLQDFSRLMRQILNNSRKPEIPLSEEISFLRNYLILEKIRFANSFTFELHCDPDIATEQLMIPPMIIQPIIENAVKYGVPTAQAGTAHIHVSIQMSGNTLIVTVADNGAGIRSVRAMKELRRHRQGKSSALDIVRERLGLIRRKQESGSLEIEEPGDGAGMSGTRVIIRIPVK